MVGVPAKENPHQLFGDYGGRVISVRHHQDADDDRRDLNRTPLQLDSTRTTAKAAHQTLLKRTKRTQLEPL